MRRCHPAESAQYWEWLRERGGLAQDPALGAYRTSHLSRALDWALGAIGSRQAGSAILDVSAGEGTTGILARQLCPGLLYHATEQSAALVERLREKAQPEAAAMWRSDHGETLLQALLGASDTFFRRYDAVILGFVLDCVDEPYPIVDECWPFVRPGGVLLVAAQRSFEHRVHRTPMDWDKLLGMLAQYQRPQIAFDDAIGGPLVAMISKPSLKESLS